MRCGICNKEEIELYDAFYAGKVMSACRKCILSEDLTIIRKPTQEQLERANQRFSVKERMMKLSGLDKNSPISKDNEVAQRNITKIRIPPKKQYSELLVPNYNWVMMMARRRKKMTIAQLSDLTKIPQAELEEIEQGVLPRNYEKIAGIVSNVLNIVMLKETKRIMPPEEIKKESETIEETRLKLFKEDLGINQRNEEFKHDLETGRNEESEDILEEVNQEIKEERDLIKRKLNEGKIDFSKREDLRNITLSDLVDIKRRRESLELKKKIRKEDSSEVIGSDIEIEED